MENLLKKSKMKNIGRNQIGSTRMNKIKPIFVKEDEGSIKKIKIDESPDSNIVKHDTDTKMTKGGAKSMKEPHTNFFKNLTKKRKSKTMAKNDSDIAEFDAEEVKKSKKPNCFQKIFFWHLNRLFSNFKEDEITEKDLNNLSDAMKIQNLEEKFRKNENKLKKNLFSSIVVIPTLRIVSSDLLIAIFLRVIVDSLGYSIPYLAKMVITEFKDQQKITLFSFLTSLSIIAISFILGILSENTIFYTKKTKAASFQVLRAKFFQKLKKCDFKFLEKANTGFISNMINIEIDRICGFIEIIPMIVSTPISISISLLLVYLQVGFIIWLPIMIFTILLLVKLLLKLYNNESRNKYSSMSSKRADILNEMIPNMEELKYSSMEQKFRNILVSLRLREMSYLQDIHLVDSLINFIEVIYPILAAAFTIAFYNQTTGSILDVVSTYSIAAIFSVSRKSFTAVTTIFDKFSYFVPANTAFELFLERVYEKDDVYEVKDEFASPVKFDSVNFERQQDTQGGLLSERIQSTGGKNDKIFIFDLEKNLRNLEQSDDYVIELVRCDFYIDFTTPKIILQEVITKKFKSSDKPKEENNTLIQALTLGKSTLTERTVLKQKQILTKILKKITLRIKNGECVCFFGLDGSGKRTLLYTLQNETVKGKGEMKILGTTSFLDSRRPCIIEGTLRENILLGSKFEKIKYEHALRIVGLDITKFAGEDFVEVVGAAMNFTNLEKKKILLARVIYNNIQILLTYDFFDEISDDSERVRLFTVLKDFYRNRVMVYSSSDLNLIKRSTRVVVLEDGKIVGDGTYKSLISDRNSKFFKIITAGNIQEFEGTSLLEKSDEQVDRKKGRTATQLMMGLIGDSIENMPKEKNGETEKKKRPNFDFRTLGNLMIKSTPVKKSIGQEFEMNIERLRILNKKSRITQNIFGIVVRNVEKRHKGTVTAKINSGLQAKLSKAISKIFLSKNTLVNIVLIVMLLFSGFAILLVELWLGLWSANILKLSNTVYFQSYFYISIGASAVYLVTQLFFKKIARQGLMLVYKEAVDGLLRKKLNFYAKTPADRIIYRMTKDLLVIDYQLVNGIEMILGSILLLLGGIIILSYATFGLFFVFFLLLGFFFVKNLSKNFKINRCLFFLSNSYKTKLQGMLMRTLKCIVTLRNLGRENFFDSDYYRINNIYQNAASHLGNASARWLGVRVTFTISSLVLVIYAYVLLSMLIEPQFFVKNLWVLSFSLNWINKLRSYFASFVPNIVAANNHVLAYYRLKEYSIEKKDKQRLKRLKVDLKAKAIEMKKVSFSYNSYITIFEDLNFDMDSGQKVCFFGKNGSGRHSLIHLITKLYERLPSDLETGETLRIFGQDVEELDPFTLRSKIIYLTDDPVLFYGTVGTNIDPLSRFDEEEIIKALHFMGIIDVMNSCEMEKLELTEQEEISLRIGFERQISILRQDLDIAGEESKFVKNIQSEEEELSEVEEEKEMDNQFVKKMPTLGDLLDMKAMKVSPAKSVTKHPMEARRGLSNLRRRGTVFMNRKKLSTEILLQSLKSKIEREMARKRQDLNSSPRKSKEEGNKFWSDYKAYTFPEKDKLRLKKFINTKNTKIRNKSIIKLIMATKAFLSKPPLLFIDQGGLQIEGVETKRLYSVFWNYLVDTSVIGILSDFDFLFNYQRVVLFENGEIVEDGLPLDLIFEDTSKLNELMKDRNSDLFRKVRMVVRGVHKGLIGGLGGTGGSA